MVYPLSLSNMTFNVESAMIALTCDSIKTFLSVRHSLIYRTARDECFGCRINSSLFGKVRDVQLDLSQQFISGRHLVPAEDFKRGR